MDYLIEPGLYALGQPDKDSPVLVTANYKLTFDKLRSALPELDAWILVLETYGINVWCAAGKRTFGTEELVHRLAASRLDEVVAHRRIILPQLGGPGVAAHKIKKLSGFKAVFGPIRAEDLPAFLEAGAKATPEMRLKSFPLQERAVLIPLELVTALKIALPVAGALFLLAGLGGPAGFWANAYAYGLFAAAALLAAVLAGVILTPLLLPWLPGRAFSVKGMTAGLMVGLAAALVLAVLRGGPAWSLGLEMAAWLIIAPAVAAFLGMNFTGSSTYTSLSGVRKEMRYAVPAQIVAGIVGLAAWFGSRFVA